MNNIFRIEAKLEVDLTKVKSETKIKTENKSLFDEKSFPPYICHKNKEIDSKIKIKEQIDNKISKKRKSKEHVLSESKQTFVGFKSHNKSHRNVQIGYKSHKKDIKSEVIESHDSKHSIKEIEKKNIETVPEVTTLRDVQLRQAFKSANTSMKKRPLTHVGGTATSDTPKPKRKLGTKEAREPVDRFSPIIILERNQIDMIGNHSKSKSFYTSFIGL